MLPIVTTSHQTLHTNDQSSDSTDSETRHLFPDIFTLMYERGISFDPAQMNYFMSKVGIVTTTPMTVKQQVIQEVPLKSVQIAPMQAAPVGKKRKESKRTLFSDFQKSVLMHWLRDHQSNPYPTSAEKQALMEKTGLNRDQVNVWFTNNRVRHGMSCSSQRHGKNSRSKLFFH